MQLLGKMKLAISLLGILPVIFVGIVYYENTKQSLEDESFKKLTAIREIKSKQVENYFLKVRNQIATFSESRMVSKCRELGT